jgi:UDP-2-acetamido-3-amino-2,3-dideoxy-glucuronate N-acetyltransferase
MIGAGAVITKPVKAYAVVVSNPAKLVGWVSEYGKRLNFEVGGHAVCKATGGHYFLESGTVLIFF